MNVFNIHLEFDHDKFRNTVDKAIAEKKAGYVCVVDGNVLSQTHMKPWYREIVRGAFVNTCDGGYIAKMFNDIYGTNYKAFNGPDLFAEYVEKPYRQLLLGNTEETYHLIRAKMKKVGKDEKNLWYMPLPFLSAEEFDYDDIAKAVNKIQPDIIWVSLGAPKQEIFMSKLLPLLKKGVMFGIGAAFNYYAGILKEPKARIGAVRFIWLIRLFEEPKKQWRRCWNFLRMIPVLRREELKRKHSNEKGK